MERSPALLLLLFCYLIVLSSNAVLACISFTMMSKKKEA